MNSCCEDNPVILCRNCKRSACKDHRNAFMKLHDRANLLTEGGREIFYCGDTLVSFILQDGKIIFINPNELIDKFYGQKEKEDTNS